MSAASERYNDPAEPSLPVDLELFLESEYGRFQLETQQGIPPAETSSRYALLLDRAREAQTDEEALQIFSVFLLLGFRNHVNEHLSRSQDSLQEDATHREQGKMLGKIFKHGLDIIDWRGQRQETVGALGFACVNLTETVAEELSDDADDYARLRSFAAALVENGALDSDGTPH